MQDTNIHSCTHLSYFLSEYPDTSLHQSLALLYYSFPTHRAIRGDGDCFYRAFAFLYLSLSSSFAYHYVFPKVTWICKNSKKILFDDYFQEYLFNTWQKYIKPLWTATRYYKEKKLYIFWNQVCGFDEVMVGYFRSANYHHMKSHRDKFLPFASERGFNYDLYRVSTFGAESEGCYINSLADVMKTRIMILCIDNDGFHPIDYMEHLYNKGFYLFFRPGHYDIVYPPQSQKNAKSNKFSFSKIFQNFRGKDVYESFENDETSTPKYRYPQSMSSLKFQVIPTQKYLGYSKKDQYTGAYKRQDYKKYLLTPKNNKNYKYVIGSWKYQTQQNAGNQSFEPTIAYQKNTKREMLNSVFNNNCMTETAGVALVILIIAMVWYFQ